VTVLITESVVLQGVQHKFFERMIGKTESSKLSDILLAPYFSVFSMQ
jgi:hypothetical protein